jgi:hypothetical protein
MSNNRWISQRAQTMPVSMFHTMDTAKAEARRNGLEIIDLSLGSSDLPAPDVAMKALRQATYDTQTHGYCLHSGTRAFRETAAAWYRQRYGGQLDPEQNVLMLIGSQEGFAHLLLAITDPGDVILAPDPGYPSYFGAIALAGLQMETLALLEENNFLADFSAIPADVAQRARVMVLTYPNNPTTGIAPVKFFQEAIDFCRSNDIFLIHDFPYVDMVYGDYEAPSLLAQRGAIDTAVELYTCSKSYHMGGFRIGWAAGNADAIAALNKVKNAVDFNQYIGIQQAAIAAIKQPREESRRVARIFEARRDGLVNALNNAGWATPLPQASMYVWTRLPAGLTNSTDFCVNLVRATGVALAPGRGFGPRGEGFVRFALVQEPDVLERAVKQVGNFLGGY